ncbi:hypothetical protein ABT297_16380 [Dactylosporangium sp. NPDC000555]|uniref:hypothetical protein n=1 Tax=Dactylosporangium sp. NPDC000555 TaxID=3154260 RepID=UPI00332750A5
MGELQEYLTGRVGRARDMAGRAAAGPLLVRLGVAVFATLSMVLGFPGAVTRNLVSIAVAGVVALLPAVFPRTRMVGLAIFACAFGWFISTSATSSTDGPASLIGTIAYGERISVVRLVALSAALYLMHSLAALAAVLPYDAVLSPGVLAGWLVRAGGIVAVSAIVSVALMVVVKLTIGPVFLVASLVGMLAVAWLVYLIARRA